MLSCICRDASLQVEMLIVKEKMLFIEVSTSVWPSRYGGRTSLGRADTAGRSFKSPSAKFCCGCGPGVGGIWGGVGDSGGSGVGRGNLVSVICAFACFFTVFAGTVAGVWFLGGNWALIFLMFPYFLGSWASSCLVTSSVATHIPSLL